MDKRLVLGLVIAVVVIVVIAGFTMLYQGDQKASYQNTTGQNISGQNHGAQFESPVTITPSVRDVYVNFRNGTPSRIFLVDSNATFGTVAADHIDQWDWRNGSNGGKDADRGDRFVSINGTIRNDYDQLLYISLDARVYDKKGNRIGTLLRSSNRPEFLAAWMGLDASDSGNFHLLLKCDKQYTADDIGRYEIVLAWEPGPTPPP